MASDPLLPPDSTPEPSFGATPPSPVAPMIGGTSPTSSNLTASGLTPNVAAGLAVVFTLISGLIFLFLEKRDQFVRFWAMQAIFLGVGWIIFSVVSAVIGMVLGHVFFLLAALWALCSMVIYLGLVVLWIVMIVQAFSGKEWEVPYIGKLARQQLANLPRA